MLLVLLWPLNMSLLFGIDGRFENFVQQFMECSSGRPLPERTGVLAAGSREFHIFFWDRQSTKALTSR